MRCPDCNKFVSYDEPQAEVQSVEADGNTIRASVRVVLNCAECGTELKDAEIEGEAESGHECKKTAEWEKREKKGVPTLEVEDDGEPTADSRLQTTDRHGKPIKSHRYMKTFYGFTLESEVKCLCCNETFTVETTAEEQASGFNELV